MPILKEIFDKNQLLPSQISENRLILKNSLKNEDNLYIDGTELPIRRPKCSIKQKESYSGKKKRHTLKAIVITNKNKEIKAVTAFYPGKNYDFSIFKLEKIHEILSTNQAIYVDSGFFGIKNLCKDHNIKEPKKRNFANS